MNTVKDTQMITIQLTLEQALAVKAAINAEIIKGAGTFLPESDVLGLGRALTDITTAVALSKESLMSRIETAVEDYMDACDYSSYRQLTAEDIDYLATEQQISPREFRDLLGLELV